MMRLVVGNNSQGPTLSDVKNGFGLFGIYERIKSLGGELNIQTGHDQGMKIIVNIPLP